MPDKVKGTVFRENRIRDHIYKVNWPTMNKLQILFWLSITYTKQREKHRKS